MPWDRISMPSLHSGLPCPRQARSPPYPSPSARRRRHPGQLLDHNIMRPLIGITSSVIARPAPQRSVYGISQEPLGQIERAGGIPLIVANQPAWAASSLDERLDGILFTGGGVLDHPRHTARGGCRGAVPPRSSATPGTFAGARRAARREAGLRDTSRHAGAQRHLRWHTLPGYQQSEAEPRSTHRRLSGAA